MSSKKRKSISLLILVSMVLGVQSAHAMGFFGRTIMRGARFANICLANGATALYTYGMLQGYYGKKIDERNKQLPTIPQDVENWARKQLATRMKNAQDVQLKIDDSSRSSLAAKRTSSSRFIKFDPDIVKELQEAFHYQNDDNEHNRRLARQVIHNAGYTLDHEAKHLIENHQLKRIGFYPATAVGTHLAGKKMIDGVTWVLKIGSPKTIPSLIVHSLGLLVGGFSKCALNRGIPKWIFLRRQERQADDFASQRAESAEKLDDVEKVWRFHQEKLEITHDTKDPFLLRILHALKDDPGHPMPGDRADRVAQIRQLKFGSK
jgi:hypothetical protein